MHFFGLRDFSIFFARSHNIIKTKMLDILYQYCVPDVMIKEFRDKDLDATGRYLNTIMLDFQ